MTDTAFPSLPQQPANPPRGRAMTFRVLAALMLREMSTTYGRSSLGYLWAILEPAAAIMLMTLVFTMAFRSPGIGTSFPLFFASGVLPFMLFQNVSQKMSVALRFSRQLLFYPGVTFLDALVARMLLTVMTQTMVSIAVFTGIIYLYDLDVILDIPAMILGHVIALVLGAGLGTLNCFLLSLYPIWERTWSILSRPLFLVSCVIFLYDNVPHPYRDWLWWNPLVHAVGQTRKGVYVTYDGSYVTPLYPVGVGLLLLTVGLLLLRRYYRDIINN